jgi:hypothetical protein
MPNRTRKQKWLTIFFFFLVGYLFVYLLYMITSRHTEQAFRRDLPPRPDTQRAKPIQDKGLFLKDQPHITGRLKIIYRGHTAGDILIDLILMDLDADYAYPRRIPINEAKRGFRLSDSRFKLVSVDADYIRLIPDID